jgi:hypothetical protein
VLFLVPLAVLHWATRGAAALRVDRARLAGMQRATHALGVPIDPRDALPDLLAEVRRCFESGVAELVVVFDNRRVVRRARAIVAAKRASTSSVSPWKAENST